MERTSDKHGSMKDDQLKKEVGPITQGSAVESRAREDKHRESPAEDQPDLTRDVAGTREAGAASGGLGSSDVLARSDLATSLSPDVFPAKRDSLLQRARENQAPDSVLRQIPQLPADTEFENVQAVWQALGGATEERF